MGVRLIPSTGGQLCCKGAADRTAAVEVHFNTQQRDHDRGDELRERLWRSGERALRRLPLWGTGVWAQTDAGHARQVCVRMFASRPGRAATTATLDEHQRNVFHVFDTVCAAVTDTLFITQEGRIIDATASNIQQLVMQLDRMRMEPGLRASLSKTGLLYTMEHHSPERVAYEYLSQLAVSALSGESASALAPTMVRGRLALYSLRSLAISCLRVARTCGWRGTGG